MFTTTRFLRRRLRLPALALLMALLAPTGVAGASPCWPAPADAAVVDPFRAPSCPYCAGNRGIEYHVPSGVVRAVATGVVTFAGTVAGTGYVVVELADGWRLTYGRIADLRVTRGTVVVAGTPLGMSRGELYLGLRIDGEYVDPAPYLGEFVGRRRLVSIDRRSRPAPAILRCGSSRGSRRGPARRDASVVVDAVGRAAGRRADQRLGGPVPSDSVASGLPPGSPVSHR